jgi:hypothetical protein
MPKIHLNSFIKATGYSVFSQNIQCLLVWSNVMLNLGQTMLYSVRSGEKNFSYQTRRNP